MTYSPCQSSARTSRYSGDGVRGAALACLVALFALCGTATSAADGTAVVPAGDYLELESVVDGRCQILSEGGKLRVLRNTHPERAVAYRLLRVFAGDHPQGLVTGVAPPGSAVVKLGCTKVDGRVQDWQVQRADFE